MTKGDSEPDMVFQYSGDCVAFKVSLGGKQEDLAKSIKET